jgi:hypothetical protein
MYLDVLLLLTGSHCPEVGYATKIEIWSLKWWLFWPSGFYLEVVVTSCLIVHSK